jgi:Fungal protein kinase
LNSLCEGISQSTKVPIKRDWSAEYRNKPLADSPLKRKPDIILKDVDNPIVTWRTVRAITEVTGQKYEVGRLVRTVVDKSYIILTTQADRVFVPILSVWGENHSFRLTVTDREGQLRSVVYELAGVRPVSLSLAFLRLIAGLCFADKPYVGYDPTMSTDQRGVVKSIICCSKTFNVVDTIYETQSLVGRATRVWQVEYGGKEFILKDAWVEKSRRFTEIQHLEHISGIQGVPEYFCGEDVMIDGKVICTGDIRGVRLPTMRVRRRIVTSTIGSHISDFKSKRELISALRDIVISALNIFFIYVLLNSPFTQR